MRLPEEFIVKIVLPYIRQKIVQQLIEEYHLTQQQVARKMWISQAAVSKLLRNSIKASHGEYLPYLKFLDDEITYITELIAQNLISGADFILYFNKKIYSSLMGGNLCKLHKKLVPELELEKCNVCGEIWRIMAEQKHERTKVILHLTNALYNLSMNTNIIDLVPEVRTNLCEALPNAKNIEDVAAFPGRLFVKENKLQASNAPMFGASKHLASVLLAVRKKFPQFYAISCIKYINGMETQLKEDFSIHVIKRSLSHVHDSKNSDNELFAQIKMISHPCDLLIDSGTYGIEPICYVFGFDAEDVSKKIIKIASLLKNEKKDEQSDLKLLPTN